MLIVALALAVIGLAALVTAVVTSNEVVAWVCIAASAIGVILLVVDAIRERQAKRAAALTGGAVAGAATTEVIDRAGDTEIIEVEDTEIVEVEDTQITEADEIAAEDHPEEVVHDEPEYDTYSDDEPEYPEAAEESLHIDAGESDEAESDAATPDER